MLIITYDEWGGYFDHVPPPVAMEPDDVPPSFATNPAGEQAYDGFARYGFRVPSVIVSPYAKADHVSSVVYDHTSVLALIERKWNLPALTYRDANANDLTNFLDLDALSARSPNFTPADVASLPAPGNTAAALACSTTGPGTIPPPGSVIPASNVPEAAFVPALALTAAAAGVAVVARQRHKAGAPATPELGGDN
jgi:phospholipase C